MPTEDYYGILQVLPTAEPEVIAAAYRGLSRKYHPDVNRSADAEQKMKIINRAYEVLSDPVERARYDQQRGTGGQASSAQAAWEEELRRAQTAREEEAHRAAEAQQRQQEAHRQAQAAAERRARAEAAERRAAEAHQKREEEKRQREEAERRWREAAERQAKGGADQWDATGIDRIYTNTIGMQFVLIPAGEFMMGAKGSRDDERPVHRVVISRSFYMGIQQVMQGEWESVMGSNPSYFKGPDLPVEQVSWEDCQEFIRRLNAREESNFYRLPTEAEWEYACRAGTNGDYAGSLDAMGWYDRNSDGQTHPVGRKTANGWGLYDMHGNVWEWCWDWYGVYLSRRGEP